MKHTYKILLPIFTGMFILATAGTPFVFAADDASTGTSAITTDPAVATTVIPVPTTPDATIATPPAEDVKVTASTLPKIIQSGQKLITDRITALNKAVTKIQSSTQTDDQKATLTKMVNDKITELNTLNTALGSATDKTAAKKIVNSIIADHRIYAVFLPQVNLMTVANNQLNHANNVQQNIIPKFNKKIAALKNKGKDTQAAQAKLDKATADLADVNTQLSSQLTQAQNLKASDYPTKSKKSINAMRSEIKSANSRLNSIGKNLKTIK